MTADQSIRELKALFESWAITASGGGQEMGSRCLACLCAIEGELERLRGLVKGMENRLTVEE